ncbi:ceramide synthase-like [Engraulis encrasicolus]|uniref:ceramide synthase-like n=1 Tax=Engraulis encrasicolus TaxID=184585 RepID=UPI002FD29719
MLYLLALGCLFFPGLFLVLKLLLCRAPFRSDREQHATMIATRLVSSIQAVMAASAGLLISSACSQDIMHNQHWLTRAYVLFATPYFAYDIVAMFLCHRCKMEVKGHQTTPLRSLIGYLQREFLMVAHHLAMVLICFPVSVFMREGKGDYFQGVMFLAELSTPSVCLQKILIQYNQQQSVLYKVNGVVMLGTFFCCRVLLFPYLYYAYSRYAGIPLYMVPLSVSWQCNAGAFLLMAPQVYWFGLICRGALRLYTRSHTHADKLSHTQCTLPHTHAHLAPANGYKGPHAHTQ